MLDNVASVGRKMVTIVDPHIKVLSYLEFAIKLAGHEPLIYIGRKYLLTYFLNIFTGGHELLHLQERARRGYIR